MQIERVSTAPSQLPFHSDGFGWTHFERFCEANFAAGSSLPNWTLADSNGQGPSRLRIVDAFRYGGEGHKQRGIDILLKMENGAVWVVQCKRMDSISAASVQKVIAKAEKDYGIRNPAWHLLWVTGKIPPDAIDFANEHGRWTLWDGRRIATEFLIHTPREQAFRIVESIFGPQWAKVFFPLPDGLLITTQQFFSTWSGEERIFHHNAAFVGRDKLLRCVAEFSKGGSGRRAMILEAKGGVGKTRLLRAVADRIAEDVPGRLVRFTNPRAPEGAEPPRFEDAGKMTVFHDDAHRLDTISQLLVGIMAAEPSEGSRLVLAARPGATDALREFLIECGYEARHIETLDVPRLNKTEMQQLAKMCLETSDENLARALSEVSDGCALITTVGAELIRQGEIQSLNLISSPTFRNEVFTKFGERELQRVGSRLDVRQLRRLLECIALLSPWADSDHQSVDAVAAHLGIPRPDMQASCDALLLNGLLVRTREGLRITPDLFSDHLAYSACYDGEGHVATGLAAFLERFAEKHSQAMLNNLAEAEWRALQQHGSASVSVLEPVWQRFKQDFAKASFWQRSQMILRWQKIAVFQPERTLELARWAMDLRTAIPESNPWGGVWSTSIDSHQRLLSHIPDLLKPVAIWHDSCRQHALSLLWQLHKIFPDALREDSRNDRYRAFAEVANFKENFPRASNGVLDWIDGLLDGPDAAIVADKPSALLATALRPIFARSIERSFMSDKRTITFQTIAVSADKTRPLRERVIDLLRKKVVPRGTVGAINALASLASGLTATGIGEPSATSDSAWQSEVLRILDEIAAIVESHPHPLVLFSVRNTLHWHVVYGRCDELSNRAASIVSELPDSLELRLARTTLTWADGDYMVRNQAGDISAWLDQTKKAWNDLQRQVVSELLASHPNGRDLHDYLNRWCQDCGAHGLTPHMGEILSEIASRNQACALEIVAVLHKAADSELVWNAGSLLSWSSEVASPKIEAEVLRCLASPHTALVRSLLHSIRYRRDFQTPSIRDAVVGHVPSATGAVLEILFGMIKDYAHPELAQSLQVAMLNRSLSDDEFLTLADAINHQIRYHDGTLSVDLVHALLDRMVNIPELDHDRHGSSIIDELARRQPRTLYEFFVKRIKKQESLRLAGDTAYSALPWQCHWVLNGIVSEPDFHELADSLLDRILKRPKEARHPWKELFRMCVVRTTTPVDSWLTPGLCTTASEDNLADLADLLGYEGSTLIFRFPGTVEAILRSARSFGPEAAERIEWELIDGVRMGPRGYTNGEVDPRHRYVRTEAEKVAQTFATNPVLGPFYQKIVTMETTDAERHRAMFPPYDADDW